MINRFAMAQSAVAMGRWKSPAIVTLAAVVALTALNADAAPRQTAPRHPKRRWRRAMPVSRSWRSCRSSPSRSFSTSRRLDPARAGVDRHQGTRDAAGVFDVVEKKEDHRSNMYDDAHIRKQRMTGTASPAGGPLTGYAASHGCVRMPFGLANKLFRKTRIGMRVIISPNDAASGRAFSPGAVQAERGCRRGCSGASRDTRPRGCGGRQGCRRGKEGRREGAARHSIAHGGTAQAGTAQGSRRRRARVRREGARHRKD